MSRRLILAALPLALLLARTASADQRPQLADKGLPQQLDGIGIDDRHGVDLPRDLVVRDHTGKQVTLGSFLDGERPLVLVMAYYQCPMLCSIVLNGLTDGFKRLAWTGGKEFRVVAVSFDPRDTVEMAAGKRDNHLKAYGRAGADWDFLLADETTARALGDAIGFHYRWDEATNQFAHAAGAFVFTPGGKLSRTMYGINFAERDLRLTLVEASEGKLGSAWDKVLLFCYHYDPNGKGYTFAVVKIMRILGTLTAVVLGFFLLRFWTRERRAHRRTQLGQTT